MGSNKRESKEEKRKTEQPSDDSCKSYIGTLEESQHRLQAIFDHGYQFIGLLSPDGILLEANRSSLKSVGVQKSDVVGQPFWNTPWWSHSPQLQKRLQRAVARVATGKFDRFEAIHPTRSGDFVHIDFSLSPVKDALGHVVYLIPEGHDITDIKHAETLLEQRVAERTDELEKSKQALAGSEERLRGILDTAAESIITIDQDGVIESFNQAAEQMFGYQKEEVIGQKVEILMPSPYSEEHQSYLNRYRNTHKARIIGIGREVIAKRKDGSIFPIHLAVSEVKHLGVYTGIIRDLTDQKQQEEAIARSEKRYRSLFEESALCLVEEDWSEVKVRLEELRDANITDLERFFEEHPEEALSCLRLREVKEVNKAALRLFGARNKEDLLSSFSGHIDADTWEDPVSLVVALLAGENEYTAEVSIEKLSGDTIPVLFHVAVAAGHENTLKRVVGTVIDISERKHAEELQRTLMAELDHRVKNILATVLSVAQQTIRRSKGLEQFKESFTGRLSALANVHRLLTAQKWQGVLLCDLVESATRPYTEESGPRVNIDGDTVLLSSKGAQAFYMILHELTTNATKYGALSIPSGRIDIKWNFVSGKDGRLLKLLWNESGGPTVIEPENKGFGSQLVERTVSYELRGKACFNFSESGFSAEFSIPLPHGSKLAVVSKDKKTVEDRPKVANI